MVDDSVRTNFIKLRSRYLGEIRGDLIITLSIIFF